MIIIEPHFLLEIKKFIKKLLKTLLLSFMIVCSLKCNKIKNEMKEHTPDYSYKNAGIDKFYYSNVDPGNINILPLVKPLSMNRSEYGWFLDTDLDNLYNEFGGGISPIKKFNVFNQYIYGHKLEFKNENQPDFNIPEKWFIINTQEKQLVYFDKELDFQAELKKLNLPETFLYPDEVYEQYKQDPVLHWFPEDIKKQLQEVKEK